MNFQVGDKVIHCPHGLGEVVSIEERVIREQLKNCYVVRTPELTIWIPTDSPQQNLRLPTPPDEFERLFDILSSPSEKLMEDRVQRKDQLMAQMNDGQLASLFRVVRDLSHFKRKSKLNDREKSILQRATNSLLTEWTYSLGTSLNQAQASMTQLLEE